MRESRVDARQIRQILKIAKLLTCDLGTPLMAFSTKERLHPLYLRFSSSVPLLCVTQKLLPT